MRTKRLCYAVWVLLPVVVPGLLLAHADPSPEPTRPVAKAEASLELPSFHLAPVKDDLDNAGEDFHKTVNALVTTADAAKNPLVRVDALLSAANLILARQSEPAATMALLLGSDPVDGEQNDQTLVAAFDRASELLKRAEDALHALADPNDYPAGQMDNLTDRLTALTAFGAAQRSFLIVQEKKEGQSDSWISPRRAASRLAPLLEVDDAGVSAAAELWQALLRSRDSDPTRALSTLDLALADPPPDTLPYSVFSRWLRCRLIAKQDRYIAALALLTQMERRIEAWFSESDDLSDALRATAIIQIQVLRSWHDHLDREAQSQERAWCARQIEILKQDRFTGEEATVLRLQNAIPILPPMERTPPSPATNQKPPLTDQTPAPNQTPKPETDEHY